MNSRSAKAVAVSSTLRAGDAAYRGLLAIADGADLELAASEVMCLAGIASTVCQVATEVESALERESMLHAAARLCDLAAGLASAVYENLSDASHKARKAQGGGDG